MRLMICNEENISISLLREYAYKVFPTKKGVGLIVLIVLSSFIIFKYFYPFANYIHGDSFVYIYGADKNLSINTYLIGYSKFLRLFSVFSRSDYILTLFQYIFLEFSALILLTVVFFLYQVRRIFKMIILFFFFLNPLFLHLANLVSSDCFFVTLSMLWLSLLLCILHFPSRGIIFIYTVVLSLAFTVRYNALIYPIVSIVAFIQSPMLIKWKITSYLCSVLGCLLFILFTCNEYKKLTGLWQFSPFSGWQMANNAMYAYKYVPASERKPVISKFRNLNNIVVNFFDSTRDHSKFPTEAEMASTFYMWSYDTPLYQYRESLFSKDTSITELKKWATVAPFYSSYGKYLILKYPWYYARYFLWPNANKYYAPPIEFLSYYNSNRDYVSNRAKDWFQYKSNKIWTRLKNNKSGILEFYPIFSGIVNMVLLCMMFGWVMLKGWKFLTRFSKGIVVMCTLWITNAAFTIFASSAALRFQSFPLMLATLSSLLLISWASSFYLATKKENISKKETELVMLNN